MSRSSRWTMPGRSGASPPASRAEQPVDERPARVARRRVDDDRPPACRRRAGARPRRRSAAARPRGSSAPSAPLRKLELDPLAARQPVALRPARSPSTERRTAVDQALGRRRASRPPAARRGTGRAARRRPRRETSERPSEARPARGLAEQQRDEQDPDADHDERVGQVERRPVAQVEEVGHVAEADPVDRGSTSSRRSAARAPPAAPGGARPSGRRRPASSRPRSAVSAVTATVALANRPNAIPEFWTWWIENGPSTCSDSSSASWLETRCFVSWSAATAASATAASAIHCGSARAERALGHRDRRQRVGARADADVERPRGALAQPRSSLRLQSMHWVVYGSASRRSAPICLPQVRQMP